MKNLFLALGAGLLFTSCAAVHVTETQTAAVVTETPKAIYIRPFSVEGAEFVGSHRGGIGERPLRQSLAPAEFAIALRDELEKIAPTRILRPGEYAPTGWLVSGSIDRVDAGTPAARLLLPGGHPVGRSKIAIHVKVDAVHGGYSSVEAKSGGTLRKHGETIYEFDVAGGSRWTGKLGGDKAPGTGDAANFDYRNAAERIRVAVEPDTHHYGVRTSTTIR